MNLWVSGVGLTWAEFASPGASHKCRKNHVESEDLSALCFWMWDPLMGLWRNVSSEMRLWPLALHRSDTAESMIVQLPFYCMKSVCHFSWDSLRDWFTRLSNVIQHQVHRLSCQKFKFWSLFSPLLIHYKHIPPKFCFCFFFFKMGIVIIFSSKICFESQVGCY